ncbi:hypothetical protein [Pseudoxanthomonas winnipegensis]|uniref:hypothetical protein n=1 Tax=Pseudoxanthomonas winnipegensis TaxID=2480810 RepID=UPI00103EDB5A|nr:hypothetical protein [Pseudoxanthomonas winnipegensis]TBV74126.1 hypothetical protein EYC45_09870 [Pseudoxanthomonas winnipegensis]
MSAAITALASAISVATATVGIGPVVATASESELSEAQCLEVARQYAVREMGYEIGAFELDYMGVSAGHAVIWIWKPSKKPPPFVDGDGSRQVQINLKTGVIERVLYGQ